MSLRSRGRDQDYSDYRRERGSNNGFGNPAQPPGNQGLHRIPENVESRDGDEGWNNDPLPEDHASVDPVEKTRPKRERSVSPDKPEPSLPKAKKPRYISPERDNNRVCFIAKYQSFPSHTRWKYTDLEDIGPRAFNEVPADDSGFPATIESWSDEESGVLCSRDGALISFHFNQMWENAGKSTWTQMREIYSSAELRMKFPIGSKLRCFYSKRDLGNFQNQATMVWRDGHSPKNCRTQEYFEDLQRIAKNLKGNQNVTNSMFSRCRDGVVQEYVSYETGLVRNDLIQSAQIQGVLKSMKLSKQLKYLYKKK